MTKAPAGVLLIEDDEALRRVLLESFRRAEIDVTEAEDGVSGLKSMRDFPARVVVTDLIMPEQEGLETIMKLRVGYPLAKIVAISGGGRNSAENYLRLASATGAHRVLAKPFPPGQLIDLVRELLNEKAA